MWTVLFGRCSRGWSCRTSFVTTVAQATLTCLAQSKKLEIAKCVTKRSTKRKQSTVTPLAVFGLQLVGNNLVLNVDHAGNHMLASTNCGLYENVSDLPQILHSTNSVP